MQFFSLNFNIYLPTRRKGEFDNMRLVGEKINFMVDRDFVYKYRFCMFLIEYIVHSLITLYKRKGHNLIITKRTFCKYDYPDTKV